MKKHIAQLYDAYVFNPKQKFLDAMAAYLQKAFEKPPHEVLLVRGGIAVANINYYGDGHCEFAQTVCKPIILDIDKI